MAEDDRSSLEKIIAHNRQLAALMTPEGQEQIRRMVLLEAALHAKVSRYADELAQADTERLTEYLASTIGQGDINELEDLANSTSSYLKMPEAIKNLKNKIASVSNAYLKKSVGNIIGGDNN